MPKYPDKIWTSSSETPQNGPILDIYNRLQSVTRQYTEKAENLDFPRFSAFFLSERAGIRTPDNLIKSQVLYRLSYTPSYQQYYVQIPYRLPDGKVYGTNIFLHKKIAGAGFEPTTFGL